MGDVERFPARLREVGGSGRHPARLDTFGHPGPAERVRASHRIVEAASQDLHDTLPGSGVKALAFAAATHLALTIGADAAGDFFEMVARVAREVGKPPEGAA